MLKLIDQSEKTIRLNNFTEYTFATICVEH